MHQIDVPMDYYV